jgi:hypothetical protein
MPTATKTKPGFLAGLKAAITANAPPDYERKIANAEHALASAQEERDRAALEADLSLPGGPERLLRCHEDVKAASTALDNLRAAQRAWEAQERERAASARAADVAKQDKVSRAAFARQAAWAVEGEAVIAAYVKWFAEGAAVFTDCRDEFGVNERLRQDMQHYGIIEPITREIAKQAVALNGPTKALPPGANVLAATTGDPSAWPTIGEHFADLANAVLP